MLTEPLQDGRSARNYEISRLRDLLVRVWAWKEDSDTKTAFSVAWIHGCTVSEEKAKECGELWDQVRRAAAEEQ